MLDLFLACSNELVEARAHAPPPDWWEWSELTTLRLTLGLVPPTVALLGVAIHRWARATTGLRRAVALAAGAGVGLLIGLVALLAPEFPPLALAPPLLVAAVWWLTARLCPPLPPNDRAAPRDRRRVRPRRAHAPPTRARRRPEPHQCAAGAR